jgi:type I restriction enzyme S subunit
MSKNIKTKKQSNIIEIKEHKLDNKQTLINTFKNCLNIMRDNEGLTGEKALRNLSYLLILKLIEPHFGREIDIDNYNYDFESYFEDEVLEINKKKLLSIVRFSNIAKEQEDNIPNQFKYLCDIILSEHPKTKNIFIKGKNFDIQHQSTYKNLIDKINLLDLTNTEYDILGNAYEEVIQDIMTGKVLGQFFTQPLIKKMMVKLIDPQIYSDGKIDTCGDPTMGTGGFLITYLQYILEQAKTKNINPDWEFIKSDGLYGKELEPDTYQLAVSNMLISSGHMFNNLDRGDSIRQPIIKKFDNILANPPFGIKGLKYDDFNYLLKNEYIPIKTDNAVSLFIQAIIYMLKINGKCAVVLPDGQDLFSKTNNTLIAIREYLLKTCDLKEIIYLPSGIFTYTSIKTCIFYFIKKKEGTKILETNIKISKTTNKEIKREYKFSKKIQTSIIKFYDYNPYEDIKNLLVEVPIDKIINNSYSLNYAEYIKEDKEQYNDDVIIKTLGEICVFLPKSKRQASYGEKNGEYPFYTSSSICNKYCNDYDYGDECLIIGTGGNANIKYSNKFSCSADNYVIKINTGQLIKYIYYYILINIEILQKGFVGVGIQHISKEYISNIKIPIPPIEKQELIIEYLDFIYEKANKTSNEKILELNKLNQICLNMFQMFGYDNLIKNLDEICEIKSGKRLPLGHNFTNEKTNYPYIRISDIKNNSVSEENIKYISEDTKNIISKYIITTNDIFMTIAGTIGNVGIIPNILNGANLTENAVRLIIKDTNIIKQLYLMKYLYYCKSEDIKNFTKGVAIPKLSIESIKKLEILIPPIEKQQEIINYCENNDKLIKQLEQEIELNKILANDFLSNIIKSKEETDVNSDTENLITENIRIEIEEKEEVIINKIATVSKVKKSTKTKSK